MFESFPHNKDLNRRLEALRDLLHGPQGRWSWRAATRLLGQWPPEEDQQLGLDYAAQHLDAWPDHLRDAPDLWSRFGTLHPTGLRLARHLTIGPRDLIQPDTLDLLVEHGAFADLTALTFTDVTLTQTALDAILTALHNTSLLTRLTLRDCTLPPSTATLLTHHPALEQLTHLDLTGARLGHDGAVALSRSPSITRLTHLDLTRNDLEPRSVGRLLDVGWPLESLSLAQNPLRRSGVQHLRALAPSASLTHLNLSRCLLDPDAITELGGLDRLDRLDRLHLGGNPLASDGVARLARHTNISSLTTLLLPKCRFAEEGALALSRAVALPSLTELDLSVNPIGDSGADALAEAWAAAGLTRLHLRGCDISHHGAQALAHGTALAGLDTLDLGFNRVADIGAASLASSRHLTRLSDLSLDDSLIGDAGVAALGGNTRWPLAHLTLSGTRTSPDALQRLVSGHLGRTLHKLVYCSSHLGDVGAASIASHLPADAPLRHLDLRDNGVGVTGVRAIAAPDRLPHLTHLLLSENLGRDLAAEVLSQSPLLDHLTLLLFDRNEVTSDGALALARSPRAQRLETLSLNHNLIGNDGAVALADSPHLTRLLDLDLSYNRIGDRGRIALQHSRLLRQVAEINLDGNLPPGARLASEPEQISLI